MITYQTESWAYVKKDVIRLATKHYAECEAAENKFPFELDVDTFDMLDDQGLLHCLIARVDGAMVGYIVNAISDRHLHFNAKTSNHLGWYVEPAFRRKLVGLKLLDKSEEELKKRGVQIMYGSHTIHADASPAFKRTGWNDLERSYVKVI